MFLKQVIIEGFKSYATRTFVEGFDPSFNAITGLNGSGKSNILDSICFVLGISNLSQVRASSLQELVYKAGQAGVSKATVTLIFNNEDKATSPVGYEVCGEITIARQIVIGGRNKYLINGHNAPPARVQNLFHSVGLNVNNPHFLIMQGRITKVINMKPPEVLSMIEEAAGTKMYENKKEAALKTIEKKERKVEEINSLLDDKITPSLAKLERERKHYMQWNTNNNDIDALNRFLIAHQYMEAREILDRSWGEGSDLNDRILVLEGSIREFGDSKSTAESDVAQLVKTRAEELDDGSVAQLDKDVEELSKVLVKENSMWSNEKVALATERETLAVLVRSLQECEENLVVRRKELAVAADQLEASTKAEQAAAKEVESAEHAMLTGAASQGGDSSGTGSAVDQLESAKREASVAETTIDSLTLRREHLKAEHKVKAEQLSKDRSNVRALEADKKKAEQAIASAKLAVHELDFNEEAADTVREQYNEERRQVAVLRERIDQLSARVGACDFRYSDPHQGFDRRKVHGLVAKLIRVKDPAMMTAIEVSAGGRLYQVVVDSDSTANELLKRGRLAKRVTILPLNKISHRVIENRQLARAKHLEPSSSLALNLIGFEDQVANAMEHVFGRTIVCPDMDSAKRVTFDKGVRARTVTVEGDTYDPSGTLSGGSAARSGSSVLALLGELADAEKDLRVHESHVVRFERQLSAFESKSKQYRKLTSALELRQHEGNLLAQRLSESATGRLLSEVDAIQEELNCVIPKSMTAARDARETNLKRVKELELLLEDADSARSRAQEEAESTMHAIRDAYSEAIAACQTARNKHESLEVQIETAEDEIKRLKEQRDEVCAPAVEKLEQDVDNKETQVAAQNSRFEKARAKLESEKQRLSASNKAIARARKHVEDLGEKLETASLEKAKLESKRREAERGRGGAEKLVASLDEKYMWIAQDRSSFGVVGTDYEFTKAKLTSTRRNLEQLKTQQDGLAKKINKKAMHMFETAKEEYRSLMEKKSIIEQDKEKIEMVIAGLDQKKMVAVERTWKKVNRDFGNIFSDLLPGTLAKLEPPAGKTVEDGLEIRVAFGEVWKDSLSELSGGQRSLIALSLILAMLRFKPAPMYILDEVDAALDLSHTQNIGRMLRRHFSGSQFVVVSLKEGMFNNANVIFRTKFVDGISTVSRTINNVSFAQIDEASAKEHLALGNGQSPTAEKENIENGGGVSNRPGGRKRRMR